MSDVHRVVIVILESEDESRAVRTPYDHYTLLRTIEESTARSTAPACKQVRLSLHQRDATASAIDDIWRR